MNTRAFLFLFLSPLTFLAHGMDAKPYQIPKVIIERKILVEAITCYADDFKDNLSDGAIILRYDKLNSDQFYISYIIYKDEVIDRPPSFYAVIHGYVVLIYTGIEPYLIYERSSFRQLFSDSNSRLLDLPVTITYDPVIWKLKSCDQDFEMETVEQFLW